MATFVSLETDESFSMDKASLRLISVQFESGLEFSMDSQCVSWAIDGVWRRITLEKFKSVLRDSAAKTKTKRKRDSVKALGKQQGLGHI